MKGIDPKEHLSHKELENPEKVQNLAPEAAPKCKECGQDVPGGIDESKQRSGKFDDVHEPKMKHGQY